MGPLSSVDPEVTWRPICQQTAQGLQARRLGSEDRDLSLDARPECQQEGAAAGQRCQLSPELICPIALGQNVFKVEGWFGTLKL